jgi:hypothetical protein
MRSLTGFAPGKARVETYEEAHAAGVEYRRFGAGARGWPDPAVCLGRRGAGLRR